MAKYSKKKYSKKTLSKSNIYGKKSPGSQAKQIYALNKKINYIQKTTKPEMCISTNNIFYKRFIDSNSHPSNEVAERCFIYKDNVLPHIVLNGDMLRPKFIKLFGMFGIYNDTTIEGAWNSAPSHQIIERQPMSAYIRIIVCRLKQSGMQNPPGMITQLNPNDVNDTTMRDLYPINGPLINDVTSALDILKSKVIKVDNNKNVRSWSIKLSSKKIGYVYKKPIQGSVNPLGQNELVVYYHFVQPATLRYSGTGGSFAIGPQCFFTMNYNIGYYDSM